MPTINLSKFVLSLPFLELLKQEKISFDRIFTDNQALANSWKAVLIDQELWIFFAGQEKLKTCLLILDQLGIAEILPYIEEKFETITLIDAWSGLASLGKKISPEIDYLNPELCKTFSFHFPFDLKSFFKGLQTWTNTIIPLTNQEVVEDIYATPSDEELQIIDKTLIKQPELLSLLAPEQPELLLMGTGNHLEELIKLSQLLITRKERIALIVLEKRELLFSQALQKEISSAQKLYLILDHHPTQALRKMTSGLGKAAELMTPHYELLTSIFPEYQNEQTNFDAHGLFERCLSSLEV